MTDIIKKKLKKIAKKPMLFTKNISFFTMR